MATYRELKDKIAALDTELEMKMEETRRCRVLLDAARDEASKEKSKATLLAVGLAIASLLNLIQLIF